MSINFEADMLDIAARQRYLRSLARPGQPTSARLWTGQMFVRFGTWLQGRRVEPSTGTPPLGTVPRLASGHR